MSSSVYYVAKIKSLSDWVSEWQGHLLSCPGQLKMLQMSHHGRGAGLSHIGWSVTKVLRKREPFFFQECFQNSDQLALAISIVILNMLLRSWSLAKPVYEQIIFHSNSDSWPRLSHHLSLRWSPSRSPSPLLPRSPSLLQSCHYPHLILPSIIAITLITLITNIHTSYLSRAPRAAPV